MKILNDKQKVAYKALRKGKAKFILYGGAAGGSKTWLGCFWLYNMCTLYADVRYFVGRDSMKDTRQSVLETWYKMTRHYGFVGNWRYSDNEIIFENGSKILFLDLTFLPQKDPFFERLGSKEYTGGWIEEAGEVRFEAFDVLKTRVGRQYNEEYKIPSCILITANAKKGWLSEFFWKPYKSNMPKENYLFIPAKYTDNQFLPQNYIENLLSITDKIKRARLLEGDFDYDESDNALMEYDAITDLFANSFVFDEKANTYITADIATYGADKFVIYVWQGLTIIDYRIVGKCTPYEVENLIKHYAEKYQVARSRIAYDADGLGTYLRSYLSGAVSIINNHTAISENYANLKTQLYYTLAKLINERKIYFKIDIDTTIRQQLIEELQEVKSVVSDAKLKIESKDDVKQRIGRSPDLSDALAFRMIFVIFNK